MLKSGSLLLLSLTSFFSYSQVNIINRSLADSSLSIAYIRIPNVIELVGYKSQDKISFSTTNGTLLSLGQHRYVLRPSKKGDCVINFQHNGRKIISRNFRSDTLLGELKIRLAGITDSAATVPQILANPFLISEIPGSYYKSPVYISNFNLTFIRRNFDSLTTSAIDNLFTKEQMDLVKQLLRGDRVLVEVYFYWPDSRRRKYPPFVIILK